jgi:3'-phosphoadenosine 5'-phosphosulfate sulfotransferase (PAPS reductase)/FAD synthetase
MSEKQHILSLSYGKDSLACIEAIMQLKYPLDGIVHAEVWATDTIQADLPEMVEFKDRADEIIKSRYGFTVERFHATRNGKKVTYEDYFYSKRKSGRIYGFPMIRGPWCNDRLKMAALKQFKKEINYLGIAIDETARVDTHKKRTNVALPLVDIGWTEAYCFNWCEKNDLLSPIYENTSRGGCWFCHYQKTDELRLLRKNHPDLWKLMMKWDKDSEVSFADGITVHDFDKRFYAEEKYFGIRDDFKWSRLDGDIEEARNQTTLW